MPAPFSGKLQIDQIELPNGSIIGMTHFPGRNHRDKAGNIWNRDLLRDLNDIKSWGATSLITLVELEEFLCLGVPNFSEAVQQINLDWVHLPIPDMSPPGVTFFEAWKKIRDQVTDEIVTKGRIVIHCASGFGRTGTIVARFMVDCGITPDNAIEIVRKVRPGTIETVAQESFIKSTLRLL